MNESESRIAAKISDQGRYLRLRYQLTSHFADGALTVTEPYNLPLNSYGAILLSEIHLGASQPEGR